MPLFDVVFDDVAYPSDPEATEAEITEQEAEGFTQVALAEGTFPKGVVAVVRGSMSPDDSVYDGGIDEDGNAKALVSITLRVEAEDEAAADKWDPPENLLTKLCDMMNPEMDLEGSWEVLEVHEVEANEPTPA